MNGVEKMQSVMAEVNKVIIGKEDAVKKVTTAILAGGHVLIEDIPGVGKTTLATAFSKAMSLEFNRMQFTPDVIPSDITGFSLYNKSTGTFEYKEGVILCNLFLADEINRASSKTQSALLEAMEEGSVTVDGVTRTLPDIFTVIATQNPVGSVGTSMLPESQLDRFMFKLSLGYPTINNELEILKQKKNENLDIDISSIITTAELNEIKREVDDIFVDDKIYDYILELVAKTRDSEDIIVGISPRGSISILRASMAYAYLCGRNFVTPDDVRSIFLETAHHRIVISPKARVAHQTEDIIIDRIIKNVVAGR